MKLTDLMSLKVHSCSIDATLEEVAKVMWDHDCGSVPLVDGEGRAVGMLTDRDLCLAAYARRQPLAQIPARAVASTNLYAVMCDRPIEAVASMMEMHRVRRVPVLDAERRPVGIVSIDDIAQAALRAHHPTHGLRPDDVVRTLAAVSTPAAPWFDPPA